jgi:hypothetical protein
VTSHCRGFESLGRRSPPEFRYFGGRIMTVLRTLTAAAIVSTLAATSAYAQAQRLSGDIQRVEGNLVFAKGRDGSALTVKLADNVVVTAVLKATVADIKPGAYIGSGAVPQADGSQRAVEVHIFAESMRGQGDGHRPGWYGAPNGTMTNGAVDPTGTVGAAGTTSGGDPVFVVKYKEGEKRIVVPSNAHIVRYEVGSKSDLKAGEQFSIQAATKQADGTFTAPRINVGKDGGRPF